MLSGKETPPKTPVLLGNNQSSPAMASQKKKHR